MMFKTLINMGDANTDQMTASDSPVDELAHEYATTDMHIAEFEAQLEEILAAEDCPEHTEPTDDLSNGRTPVGDGEDHTDTAEDLADPTDDREIDVSNLQRIEADVDVLARLHHYACKLGEIPTAKQIDDAHGLPSSTTYMKRFGSIENALWEATRK